MKVEEIREIVFGDNDYANGVLALLQILVEELDKHGEKVAAVYVQTALDTFVTSRQYQAEAAMK